MKIYNFSSNLRAGAQNIRH